MCQTVRKSRQNIASCVNSVISNRMVEGLFFGALFCCCLASPCFSLSLGSPSLALPCFALLCCGPLPLLNPLIPGRVLPALSNIHAIIIWLLSYSIQGTCQVLVLATGEPVRFQLEAL